MTAKSTLKVINMPFGTIQSTDSRVLVSPYTLANSTRLPALRKRVDDWTKTLVTPIGGAFSQPAPSSNSVLPEAPTGRVSAPIYQRMPNFSEAYSGNLKTLILQLAPPGSVLILAPSVPEPNLSYPFSQTQSEAIASALSPQTVALFKSLPDDRQKILARTLLVIALTELNQDVIKPREFSYVIGQIFRAVNSTVFARVPAKSKLAVPGATPVAKQQSNRASQPPVGVPVAATQAREPSVIALSAINRKADGLDLSAQQKQELIQILSANWKIEKRAGTTKLDFESYLKSAKPSQWADWINSAKDVGFQDEQETWEKSLLPFVGTSSSLIADVRLAFPNAPAKRRHLAELIVSGLSLQQGVARIKGVAFSYSQVQNSGDQIVVHTDKAVQRNENSRGPAKLHKDFPVQLANLIDSVAPMQWFAIKNSAGNWSVRIRERVGAPYGPFATVQVPASDAQNRVLVVRYKSEISVSEQVVNQRLAKNSVNDLNNRFGVGKWTARNESLVSVGILVSDVRKGYVSTREGQKQQFVQAKTLDQTRADKSIINQNQVARVNDLAGSDQWYLRKESPNRLVAVMPKSGRFIARFYPEINHTPTTYRLVVVTLAKPQDGSFAGLPKEIIDLCDTAFGEGKYRANFIRPGYFQVLAKVHSTALDESSYLGSLTLKPDPRTGVDKWVLKKAGR